MNDHKKEETMLPDWMCSGETYVPSKDKEAFLTKSTKSVLSVLAKMRFYEGKDGKFSATPSLKLFYTLLYIVLTACSGNYLFTLIMCAAVTVRLAFFSAKAIRQILRGTAGAVLFYIDPSPICIYGNSSDFNEYYFKSICICNSGWYFVIRNILE